MSVDPQRLSRALANTRSRLLAERTANGWWEGELSSSALSTATALFALSVFGRSERSRAAELEPLVRGGLAWLIRHQNADGGWGDTLLSVSNISTTALCWAAFSVGGDEAAGAVRNAEEWLTRAAGSMEPTTLARAIEARYGKDRTFSVPILTMCAIAGRLGKGREGWKRVPVLPFELAAFPRDWYSLLGLPVVSYALPALIAIGQAIHHQCPTWNPAARGARIATRAKTLRVLEEIQPDGGGFLEATPLTSFVLMSLVAGGQAQGTVARHAVEFLVRSVRPDGSWPIDTNLATWVTTLSINALGPDVANLLSSEERERIRDWLLGQQYRTAHPYTGAEPGAWAWTDLPGGVPDADDTPGALLALRHLGEPDDRTRSAAAAGARWLFRLQNTDGGIPTFCKGWGKLPFDRSGADLTAHALLAWHTWCNDLPADEQRAIDAATVSAIRYLERSQRADGAWIPLWFGNQEAPDDENPTYGTARVLPALAALRSTYPNVEPLIARGLQWLLSARNADGGWGGNSGTTSSIEETSLALYALAEIAAVQPTAELSNAIERGTLWLIEATEGGTQFEPSPIGFYFAKLWYFERLYPVIFAAGALGKANPLLWRCGAPTPLAPSLSPSK